MYRYWAPIIMLEKDTKVFIVFDFLTTVAKWTVYFRYIELDHRHTTSTTGRQALDPPAQVSITRNVGHTTDSQRTFACPNVATPDSLPVGPVLLHVTTEYKHNGRNQQTGKIENRCSRTAQWPKWRSTGESEDILSTESKLLITLWRKASRGF